MDWVHLDGGSNEWVESKDIHLAIKSLFKPLDQPTSLMKWHRSPCIKSSADKWVCAKCFEDENQDAKVSKVSSWGWKWHLCVFLLHHESPRLTLQKISSPKRRARETQWWQAFIGFTRQIEKEPEPVHICTRGYTPYTFATYSCRSHFTWVSTVRNCMTITLLRHEWGANISKHCRQKALSLQQVWLTSLGAFKDPIKLIQTKGMLRFYLIGRGLEELQIWKWSVSHWARPSLVCLWIWPRPTNPLAPRERSQQSVPCSRLRRSALLPTSKDPTPSFVCFLSADYYDAVIISHARLSGWQSLIVLTGPFRKIARPPCKFGSEPPVAALLIALSPELGGSLSAWQRLPPSCTPKLVTAERMAFTAWRAGSTPTEGTHVGSSLWGGGWGSESRGGAEEVGCNRGNCRAARWGPENWLKWARGGENSPWPDSDAGKIQETWRS